MPPTEQEARCIRLTAEFLSMGEGATWSDQSFVSLDEAHPGEPSPEGTISNGTQTAAIEVKRLMHATLQEYGTNWRSLRRSLVPPSGGGFMLLPALNFTTPLDLATRKKLRSAIERAAAELQPGDSGSIAIERSSYQSLAREGGTGHIHCCHQSTGDEVQRFSPQMPGAFFLVDCESWEHTFLTDTAREAFGQALVSAAHRRIETGVGELTWIEEWRLDRYEDEDPDDPCVDILSVSEAFDVRQSVADAAIQMIEKATKKFAARRWADKHVLVLDRDDGMITAAALENAVTLLTPADLIGIDLVLFTDGETVRLLWSPNDER